MKIGDNVRSKSLPEFMGVITKIDHEKITVRFPFSFCIDLGTQGYSWNALEFTEEELEVLK